MNFTRKILFVFVILAVTLFAACSPKEQQVTVTGTAIAAATPVNIADLQSTAYKLYSVNGKLYENSSFLRVPTLQFTVNFEVSGSVCNRFAGKATLENSVLKAPDLMSTRMICPDDKSRNLENSFMNMLATGAQVSRNDNELILRNSGNILIFNLVE